MFKIFYTHQKKKTNFRPKKNVWCSRKSLRKRNHFFKRNNILHPPEKANLFPDEIISHFSLKKPKFHRKRISYTTTENPTFQPNNIIILSRKNPISEGKNILHLSEKNSKFLILPPHPNWRQFRRRKFFFRVHKIFRTQVFAGIVVFSFCF